jgi:hypothetical protein
MNVIHIMPASTHDWQAWAHARQICIRTDEGEEWALVVARYKGQAELYGSPSVRPERERGPSSPDLVVPEAVWREAIEAYHRYCALEDRAAKAGAMHPHDAQNLLGRAAVEASIARRDGDLQRAVLFERAAAMDPMDPGLEAVMDVAFPDPPEVANFHLDMAPLWRRECVRRMRAVGWSVK